MSESGEEPDGLTKFFIVLTALLSLIFGISLIAKMDVSKQASFDYWFLAPLRFKWWALWTIFVVSLAVFLFLLNYRRKDAIPEKPDQIDIESLGIPRITPKLVQPPPLELPSERTSKRMDERSADVWAVCNEWQPKLPTKETTFQDQLYYKLKKALLHKYSVTPEFKRSSRKPDILIGSDLGVELKEATPAVVEGLQKRLSQLRVEYKQVIVLIVDRGRVPVSEIDTKLKESMAQHREIVAAKVVKF